MKTKALVLSFICASWSLLGIAHSAISTLNRGAVHIKKYLTKQGIKDHAILGQSEAAK